MQAGYGVYGIDHEGHGRSSGSRCYIPNFGDIIADCSNHFTSICGMNWTTLLICFADRTSKLKIQILNHDDTWFQRNQRIEGRRGSCTAFPWAEAWLFSSIGRHRTTGTAPSCLLLCARSGNRARWYGLLAFTFSFLLKPVVLGLFRTAGALLLLWLIWQL